MLILAETPEQASQHLETLLWVLQALGFIVNLEKSVLTPIQEIEFLGLETNLRSMELSLPGEKLKQIRGEAAKLLTRSMVSARSLSQFIGKLNAAAQAVAPAPLFYRHLQDNLKNALASGDHELDSNLSEAQEELSWWQQPLETWNGRCLLKGQEQVNLQWHADRRSMVRAGEDMAHQLPGDAGSLPDSPGLPEKQIKSVSASAGGQYHSSSLYQQSGGNSIPTTD